MKPQAVCVRHQEKRERDGEEDPEREATVVGNDSQIGQEKRGKKNGDHHRQREAIRDDHSTDVVTLLAEERKAAARALRINFIRPAGEHASLLAVGAAQAERIVKDTAEGQGARFLHLGQPNHDSIPPSRTPSIWWCLLSNSRAGLKLYILG
jgi:hypothetical protein